VLFDEVYGARPPALPDSVTAALLALARARVTTRAGHR